MEARLVYLYVDGAQVGTLFSRWPLKRILARLSMYNPKAQSLEVTVEMKPSGNNALPTIAQVERSSKVATDSTLPEISDAAKEWPGGYRRAIGERAARQAKKDDPGR